MIPKGLCIDLEPSIGNDDEDFCAAWFAKIKDFSLSLMTDVIKYCEKVENEAEEKICLNSDTFKTMMNPEDHKDLSETMDNLAIQRQKRLSLTKRKKFYYLRYNRPEKRSTEERRSSDRQAQNSSNFNGPKRHERNARRNDDEWNARPDRRSARDRRDYRGHEQHQSDAERGYDASLYSVYYVRPDFRIISVGPKFQSYLRWTRLRIDQWDCCRNYEHKTRLMRLENNQFWS